MEKNMENLFCPIYEQIEKEFKELSILSVLIESS